MALRPVTSHLPADFLHFQAALFSDTEHGLLLRPNLSRFKFLIKAAHFMSSYLNFFASVSSSAK